MKTKLLILTFLILNSQLSIINCKAQAPSWQWVQRDGGSFDDVAYSIALDASGNNYVTGTFSSPTITFGTSILTNNFSTKSDIFVVKHDPSGNVIWAKSAGGSSYDISTSVAVDHSGNVYVVGYFQSPTITFGASTLINPNPANASDNYLFLLKYDHNGNEVWAKYAGGNKSAIAKSVVVDNAGNIYVAGFYQSTSITFGTTTLTSVPSFDPNAADVFLTKYDSSGNVVWAKTIGSDGDDRASSVFVDGSGNIFLSGFFYSAKIGFGTDTLINTYAGTGDIFIAKYSATGNVLWAKSAGGNQEEYPNSMTVDNTGNIYIVGRFYSPVFPFNHDTLTLVYSPDIFILKYDAGGNPLWAKGLGGNGYDEARSVAADAVGNFYVSGFYNSPTIVIGNTTLTNKGSFDLFLSKFDGSGNVLWTKGAGGTDDDDAHSVAVDLAGSCYITGYFYSPSIIFGSDTLINANSSGFQGDIFIAKTTNTTGIENLNANDDHIIIYPNPNNGTFTVSDLPNGMNNYSLDVFDLIGNIVYAETINSTKHTFDLKIPSGIYFLQVKSGNMVYHKKFVKNE